MSMFLTLLVRVERHLLGWSTVRRSQCDTDMRIRKYLRAVDYSNSIESYVGTSHKMYRGK
jgi:hypothetical protein